MLPLQQSFEVKQSILEYLKATFSFKEKRLQIPFMVSYKMKNTGCLKDLMCL